MSSRASERRAQARALRHEDPGVHRGDARPPPAPRRRRRGAWRKRPVRARLRGRGRASPARPSGVRRRGSRAREARARRRAARLPRRASVPIGVAPAAPRLARREDDEERDERRQVRELPADERRRVPERDARRALRVGRAGAGAWASRCAPRSAKTGTSTTSPAAIPAHGAMRPRVRSRGARGVGDHEDRQEEHAGHLRRARRAREQSGACERQRRARRCPAGSAGASAARVRLAIHRKTSSRSGVSAKRPMAISGTSATTMAVPSDRVHDAPHARQKSAIAQGTSGRQERRDEVGVGRLGGGAAAERASDQADQPGMVEVRRLRDAVA